MAPIRPDIDGAAMLARALWAACLALLVVAAPASARLTWTGPVARDTAGSGPGLTSVSCPASHECVAVDVNGGAVSFDPAVAGPRPVSTIDATFPTQVTCPTATRCVAVDINGGEVTFDPTAPARAVTTSIDPGKVLTGISCPVAATTCTAIDSAGNELTFDPSAPGRPAPVTIDTGQVLTAISCPAATICMAVDGHGNEVSFNPQAPSTALAPHSIDGTNPLTDVACPSATECLAFDGNGTEMMLNPASPSSGLSTSQIDQGHAINSAVCTSTTQCTVVDSGGGEVTFNPNGSSPRARVLINGTSAMSGVACPQSSGCVAIDGSGHAISFVPDRTGLAVAAASTLVDGEAVFSAVACPLANQCTAADESGNEVTFDPRSSTTPTSAPIDPGGVTIYALACPTAIQCTGVDQTGREVTFNPRQPGSPAPVQVVRNHPLLAIACPSAVQCTAVDDDQFEITFNPQAPGTGRYGVLGTPAGSSITGVACPSVTQCTAVDATGEEATFNPQNPASIAPVSVLGSAAVGVACPSVSSCAAIDASGTRATFDPRLPAPTLAAQATKAAVDDSQPVALSCPSTSVCIAPDAAGRAVEFDPGGSGSSAVNGVGASGSLTGLACQSAAECVAVDATGRAFLAAGPIPPAPVARSSPRITGAAAEGRTLREVHGAWSGAPTSYALQWLRCAPRSRCAPIPDASGPTYTLGPRDDGDTIRVSEQALNAGGSGVGRTSRPTRRVTGLPRPARFARTTLSGVGRRLPKLAVTLTAARYGPALRQVTVVLPPGLRFDPIHSPTGHAVPGISVRVRGHEAPFSLHVSGRTLVITLRHTTGAITLALSFPGLSADAALARTVKRRKAVSLALTAAVPSGRRLLRAVEKIHPRS